MSGCGRVAEIQRRSSQAGVNLVPLLSARRLAGKRVSYNHQYPSGKGGGADLALLTGIFIFRCAQAAERGEVGKRAHSINEHPFYPLFVLVMFAETC